MILYINIVIKKRIFMDCGILNNFVIYKQFTSRKTKPLQEWTSYGETNTKV
jgi:hypothetical protein